MPNSRRSQRRRPFVNPRFFRARSEDFQIKLQITNKRFQPRTVRGEVNLGTWLGPLGRAIFLGTLSFENDHRRVTPWDQLLSEDLELLGLAHEVSLAPGVIFHLPGQL